MKKICIYFFITGGIIHAPCKIRAQVTDTLKPVELHSKKPLDISITTVNVQQLNKNSLSKLNSVSVADAVKYFPGVVVKDYGGIGGLKTVSVRSLGANHTGVMYDGIMVSDAQGGQIDLGRFSLDNIETIQLFNNQPEDILLPARSYASASVISLLSSATNNKDGFKNDLAVRIKTGSFGFINPAIYYRTTPGKRFSTAINGEYQYAKGNYSFNDYETGQSKHKRNNSDINSYRLEYDATYEANDSNLLKFKTYYYNSKRGLPGAVILYSDYSDERLNNESFFSQLTWQRTLLKNGRLMLSGKYSSDYKFYLDPSYQNSAGKLENKFQQKEYYISAAYSYKIISSLTAAYSVDYFINNLKRTDEFAINFANPQRNTLLNNLSLQWKRKYAGISANLLHTYIAGKVKHGNAAGDLHELTPAIAVSIQPFLKIPVRIRVSYKRIFRVPSFDDLYYTNIGNVNLRPEYANLYNVGITLSINKEKFIKEIVFTTDAYYNRVRDKIIAVPRQNLFQWTMLNIGTASVKGIDAAGHLNFERWYGFEIGAGFSYSYQKALDVSDPGTPQYKNQLPYVPVHSGSINVSVNYNKCSFAYNILSSSYRYRLGEQGPENVVQGWAMHDINVNYTFSSKTFWTCKLIAEANNIFNTQYEVIKYYPMPRFNYRAGLIITFKNK